MAEKNLILKQPAIFRFDGPAPFASNKEALYFLSASKQGEMITQIRPEKEFSFRMVKLIEEGLRSSRVVTQRISSVIFTRGLGRSPLGQHRFCHFIIQNWPYNGHFNNCQIFQKTGPVVLKLTEHEHALSERLESFWFVSDEVPLGIHLDVHLAQSGKCWKAMEVTPVVLEIRFEDVDSVKWEDFYRHVET